jgi:hypothetical protein
VARACSCIYHLSEDDVGEEAAWLIVDDGLIVGRCIVRAVLFCIALHCIGLHGLCFLFVLLGCGFRRARAAVAGMDGTASKYPLRCLLSFFAQVCTCLA